MIASWQRRLVVANGRIFDAKPSCARQRGACSALHRQQRLVHQALDLVEDLANSDAIPGAHRCGGFQVEAPREDRQSGE
jgi:hypothetical protein